MLSLATSRSKTPSAQPSDPNIRLGFGETAARRSFFCACALDRQKRPSSRGFGPSGCPSKPLVSYQINRQLSGRNPPPLVTRAFGTHRNVPIFTGVHQRASVWHPNRDDAGGWTRGVDWESLS
jgi:hypothetical protein